jgi:antitoxin HicB
MRRIEDKPMATQQKLPRYTVVIQWSDADECFIASLPEWAPHAITHAAGDTYEEAARNAGEILELLMKDDAGKPAALPPEKHFQYPGTDVVPLPAEEPIRSRSKAGESKSRRSA